MLHVLQAADINTPAMISVKLLKDTARDGAELTLPTGEKARVWFTRDGEPALTMTLVENK